MYGLIGKFTAKEGCRDNLIDVLLAQTDQLPGCLSFIVAKDATDPLGVWVTQIWENADIHRASLELPVVRKAIADGCPFVARLTPIATLDPIGGHGLSVQAHPHR